jgi:hypothetical protein
MTDGNITKKQRALCMRPAGSMHAARCSGPSEAGYGLAAVPRTGAMSCKATLKCPGIPQNLDDIKSCDQRYAGADYACAP